MSGHSVKLLDINLRKDCYGAETVRDSLERADILVLGWHNRRPSTGLVKRARALKAKGLCRFIAMSGHQRRLFPKMAAGGRFDLFHVRYNAAHRGAEAEIFPRLPADNRILSRPPLGPAFKS